MQNVDRLRSVNDDVRRAELESLGHGLDGVGCNPRVPPPRPKRTRMRQDKDVNVVTEKVVERLLLKWAAKFSAGRSVFVWPLCPSPLSLLFVFAGSLGPKSRASAPPPPPRLRTKKRNWGPKAKENE